MYRLSFVLVALLAAAPSFAQTRFEFSNIPISLQAGEGWSIRNDRSYPAVGLSVALLSTPEEDAAISVEMREGSLLTLGDRTQWSDGLVITRLHGFDSIIRVDPVIPAEVIPRQTTYLVTREDQAFFAVFFECQGQYYTVFAGAEAASFDKWTPEFRKILGGLQLRS